MDSWDLRDQRTRGLKGYACGEEPTVGQDEFEGRDESDEASLMEQGKNGVWRTKQVWWNKPVKAFCREKPAGTSSQGKSTEKTSEVYWREGGVRRRNNPNGASTRVLGPPAARQRGEGGRNPVAEKTVEASQTPG